ncbi:MAG: hypothetical protein K8T20_14820 [Planctomycetes bacterium]|nr:hypothetical protein [Planctomycetota bacterium]
MKALPRPITRFLALALLLSSAGCGKPADTSGSPGSPSAASGRRRIHGATPVVYAGVSIDVPEGWTTRRGDGNLALLAPPTSAWFSINVTSSTDVRTLDPAAFAPLIDDLGPLAKSVFHFGAPKTRRCGDFDALEWSFTDAPEKGGVEIRKIGLVARRGIMFTSMGTTEGLRKRDDQLDAILASVAPAPPPPIPLDSICTGWYWWRSYPGRTALVPAYLKLRSDMTYEIALDLGPDTQLGYTVQESGPWSLDGDEITFHPTGLSSRTLGIIFEDNATRQYQRLVIGGEPWTWDEFQSIHH